MIERKTILGADMSGSIPGTVGEIFQQKRCLLLTRASMSHLTRRVGDMLPSAC